MTARDVALQVLLDCRQREAFIQEALNQRLCTTALSVPDRRLVTQLTYGVLRRRATLDALVNPFVARPLGLGKENVQETLRLGVYQLTMLSHIPVHAAVNETVRLMTNSKIKGFVNGVLRNVARLLTDGMVEQPGADALPLEGGNYRQLAKAVLPSPSQYPVEYLAAGFALPQWLVRRWLARYDWDECLRLGFWFAATPPLWLRCNTLKTDRHALLTALQAAGVEAKPGGHPQAIQLCEHGPIRDLPGFGEGWFAVQDESAMQVATALAPLAGDNVLDLCAAPGTKTMHLAELMGNQGRILACDVEENRLQTLRELAQRLGVTIVQTRRLDREDNGELPDGPFDAILVDAPCSNTGVLGRRPEVRWRMHENDLVELARLQTKLLLRAAERLKPGGKMVYSTCSIEPEENQQVVANALRCMTALSLEEEREQRPGAPADGGYWARLKRRKQ
jgi:16S rRNA (cytosine967-C5)-methyltransferase